MKDPNKIAALGLIMIAPVAYLLGGVTLDVCKGVLLAATVAWYAASVKTQ